MADKRLAPQKITVKQDKHLNKEARRTGASRAEIVRRLIQADMERK